MGAFSHIYMTADDLPCHLQDFVESHEGLPFAVFKHPFYTTLMPLALPADVDTVLSMREDRAHEFLAEGDYRAYVFRHERPFRMQTLIRLSREVDFASDLSLAFQFWELAGDVWSDAEADESDPIWSRLMNVPVPGREAMGGEEGWCRYVGLPDTVTVYRGLQGASAREAEDACGAGWAWTLEKRVAAFFARRHLRPEKNPYIATARIPKKMIEAVLLGRNESETLIRPWSVTDVEIQRIERKGLKRR